MLSRSTDVENASYGCAFNVVRLAMFVYLIRERCGHDDALVDGRDCGNSALADRMRSPTVC